MYADIAIAPVEQQRRAPAELFLHVLGFVLLGYALAGRGFAYLGVPPAYIGELMLAVGLLVAARQPGFTRLLRLPPVMICLLMMAWGMARTLPYVSEYRMDALRDAVIWGYALWALVIAHLLISRPKLLSWSIDRYRRFACLFLLLMPVFWIIFRTIGERLPALPGTETTIIVVKAGDVMVHLASIVAFMMSGLWGTVAWYWPALIPVTLVLGGSTNRGGLLSFMATFAVCLVLRPASRVGWNLVAILLCALLMLALFDVRLGVTRADREVSVEQMIQNLLSVADRGEAGGLDQTKQWRLNWWRDIWDYTIHGPHFWTGKGFGINLADDDGYQVVRDSALRSPHNGHLAMLARAGLPGFLLWIAAQLSWAFMIFDRFYRSTMQRQVRWAGLFFFLLAFWVAMMANTSFDVFIEGPMGGIWFWCMYGLGLAALHIHREAPESLDDHHSIQEVAYE